MKSTKFGLRVLRAALMCSALAPAPLLAQTATPDAVAAQDATTIDDIVVTARFRAERLQDTPLSVSAFNSETIQNSVITDVQSVQKFLPNVQLGRVNFAGNSLAASIRGISFSDLEKTFDPAIGVAIDGVFLGTSTGGNVDFNDVASVEVLRGPQGTLYGRNTVGGTISLRRTRPTGELGAKFHARYGSYDSLDLDTVINLPTIADVFDVKLYGLSRTSDSFTENRYTGEPEDGRDYYQYGVSVLAHLGAETTLLGTVEYERDRSHYPTTVNLTQPTGLPFGAGGTICDFGRSLGQGNRACDINGYLRQRDEGYTIANTSIPFASFLESLNSSLELNTTVGRFNLTAVTGYRDTNDQLLGENTGSEPLIFGPGVSVPLFVAARDQNYTQFSQEVRIQGDINPWMDLVAGVYYLHTEYDIQPNLYNGARTATAYFLGTPAQSFTASQQLDSYAIFAESIFKLGHDLRLTVGGRYTTETKEFAINNTIPAPGFSADVEETWSDPSGRVILDWKPNENAMLYASWSRGVRSGGFNGRATTAASVGPYDPERVDSFEAGLKADFFDGRLRFNPTVFLAEYADKQEEVTRPAAVGVGTETVVQNAASASIKGFEVDIQARPTTALTLRLAGGYLDAEYDSFIIPNLSVPGTTIDVANSRNFRRAPKYTINAGMEYVHRVNDSNSVNLTVDYAYIDDFTTSPEPDTTGAKRDEIEGRSNIDASVSWVHTGENFKDLRLSAYVRDAFHDDGRITNTLDVGIFYFATVAPNRLYGIEATVSF